MLNGFRALEELEAFVNDRKYHGQDLSPQEREVIDIVKRDAIHAINCNIDQSIYSEYDRLKLVELEYMYQVRGVRQVMPSAIFREGYAGYGNSWTGSTIRLLYPQDRKRSGRMSREPILPIDKIRETATLTEQLVPLRINVATDKYRLKDRVIWNVDDTTIPLELFVEITLEDYGLPLSLAPSVSKSLQEQISNHVPHIYPVPPGSKREELKEKVEKKETKKQSNGDEWDSSVMEIADPEINPVIEKPADSSSNLSGSVSVDSTNITDKPQDSTINEGVAGDAQPPANTTETLKTEIGQPNEAAPADATEKTAGSTEEKPEEKQEPPYDEDMRFTIKLDITIGHHQLVDQFEWDINNPENDPELFGLVLANDLALPLEFSTAIAHAIREQAQAYSKALFNSGYQFDGKLPGDVNLQNELAMPVNENQFLRRPELLPSYTPKLLDAKISGIDASAHEQEVERREIRSRRRMGRSSRRGHHDNRSGISSSGNNDVVFLPQEVKGPDVCTPVFSSALPGGVDRNLSILYMTVYQNDENNGGDKQDLVYYFHKRRRERNIPCVSQYERSLIKLDKPRWMVTLKIPKGYQF